MQEISTNKTTIERGDAFRDLVSTLLSSAGFVTQIEVMAKFKKVDVACTLDSINGSERYAIEAKDYSGTLDKNDCGSFTSEYGTLVRNRDFDRAWLISKGPISAAGRTLVNENAGCQAMTFEEFQRRLLNIDSYLVDLIAAYEGEQTETWYIPSYLNDGRSLEEVARDWIEEADALPIAIVAGYGKGKSTFARHFASKLAKEALKEPWRRVPILVPLSDIVDEQSLEGLLGKLFTSRPGVRGYNFGLFEKLNHAGRFIIFFDGLRRNEARHDASALSSECHRTHAAR